MTRTITRVAIAVLVAANAAPAQQPAVQAGAAPFDAEERTARHFETLRGDPVAQLIFLRAMPKGADLHSHLSGAIYAETYIEWAAEAELCVDTVAWTFAPPPCDAAAGRPPATAAAVNPALRDPIIDALSVRNWQPGDGSAHGRFFGTFDRFRLVSHRTGDMLAEVAARAAAGGVSYLELMQTLDGNGGAALGRSIGWDDDFDRLRTRLLGAGLRDTLAAARRRMDEVEARQRDVLQCASAAAHPGCAVVVRFLYQALRARPPEIVFAHLLAGFELAATDSRVVGVNLVQPEDHPVAMRDYSLHMRMIAALRRHYPDVRVTLHAGELAAGLVPPEGLRFHITEAVRVAGADRVGHGTSVGHEDDAEALVAEMARRRTLVEVALGSNDFILGIRAAEHPLRLYMRSGVPVALVTDDEGVLRSDLTQEFLKAVREHGIGYVELKTLARNSLEHAFVEGQGLWTDAGFTPVGECRTLDSPSCDGFVARSTKARLQRDLERAFATFEARHARTATAGRQP
jgi:adenosine deaminase